jgi:hypothetical protein
MTGRRVANPPQDGIPPHIAASRKRRRHSSGAMAAVGRPIANLPRIAASRKRRWRRSRVARATGRPIANRPQVANLPHKSSRRAKIGMNSNTFGKWLHCFGGADFAMKSPERSLALA